MREKYLCPRKISASARKKECLKPIYQLISHPSKTFQLLPISSISLAPRPCVTCLPLSATILPTAHYALSHWSCFIPKRPACSHPWPLLFQFLSLLTGVLVAQGFTWLAPSGHLDFNPSAVFPERPSLTIQSKLGSVHFLFYFLILYFLQTYRSLKLLFLFTYSLSPFASGL